MNEVASGNPKDLIGLTKPPIWMVPRVGVIYTAMAFQDGANKYGAYNWRDYPVKASVYIAAADRHMAAYLDGEWLDPKSGVPHLAHASACNFILMDAFEGQHLVDDRPKQGQAAELIRRLTQDVRQSD